MRLINMFFILLPFVACTLLDLLENGAIGQEMHEILDQNDFEKLWKLYPNHYHFQQRFDETKRVTISIFWNKERKLYTRIESKIGDHISLYHLSSIAKLHSWNYQFKTVEETFYNVQHIAASCNEFAILKNGGVLIIFDLLEAKVVHEFKDVQTVAAINEGILAKAKNGTILVWNVTPKTFVEEGEIFSDELQKYEKQKVTKSPFKRVSTNTTTIPLVYPISTKMPSKFQRFTSRLKNLFCISCLQQKKKKRSYSFHSQKNVLPMENKI